MRSLLLASVAAIGLALTVPAMAQSASNIDKADTRSDIAPRLPAPPVSTDAGPRPFLQAAQVALRANRTGEAQEALERAESRSLDVSDNRAGGGLSPMGSRISAAREALGRGDVAGASRIVDAALAGPPGPQAMASPSPAVATASPSTIADATAAASGSPSAIAGMPAAGVTVYDNHELPLPSIDDSMTSTHGDNSFTVRATGEHTNDDFGPGADSAN
jgi:hypothetical protein